MALAYAKKEERAGGFQKDESEHGLVSMELDDEDQLDGIPMAMPSGKPVAPQFPYGLRISMSEKDLERLKLSYEEANVGDYLEFRARACVTSASEHKIEAGGTCCRVELQIESMKILGEGEG